MVREKYPILKSHQYSKSVKYESDTATVGATMHATVLPINDGADADASNVTRPALGGIS